MVDRENTEAGIIFKLLEDEKFKETDGGCQWATTIYSN